MKRKLFKTLLILTFCIASSVEVFASGSIDPFSREMPSIMQSVEAMGMGGAFYGKSDDKYAGFYNPAGLYHYKGKWSVDLLPVTLGMNENAWARTKDLSNLIHGGLKDPGKASDFIGKMMGKYTNVSSANFFPAFTMKNFSFGIFSSNQMNMVGYNNVLPEVAIRGKSDTGAMLSFSIPILKDKSLSFGFSLKGLYRISFAKSYTATELSGMFANGKNGLDSILRDIKGNNTGWGIYGSVGVMYDLPLLKKYLAPRIGVSFNDFGYSHFTKSMEKIVPTLNASIAFSPHWGPISSDFVVDFTDILCMAGYDKSFGKRVNLGAEIGFWNKVFLRVGLHQGYISAGAGVNLWNVVKLNYAYYTEELGSYAGQYKDTRHVLEAVIGF